MNTREKLIRKWSLFCVIIFVLLFYLLILFKKAWLCYLGILLGMGLLWLSGLNLVDSLVELYRDLGKIGFWEIYSKIWGLAGIENSFNLVIVSLIVILLSLLCPI